MTDNHRQDYSSSNKKLLIDGRFYKYDGNEATKTLRLSIFKKLNTIIGKQMSKAEGKRWKNRQKMTDAVVQDYRRLMSTNKLQKFYKNEMTTTVMEGDSA